jgi:hypothetical protein
VKFSLNISIFQLSDSEREAPEKQALDAGTIYSRLLEILQDKETIAGALKKLNIQKGWYI